MNALAEETSPSRLYRGLAASDGLVFAPVVRFEVQTDTPPPRYTLEREQVNAELARFFLALDQSRTQVLELAKFTEAKASATEAGIFDSQLMMIEDDFLVDKIVEKIRVQCINVEAAVYDVFNDMLEMMAHMGNDYLRERSADIFDVRGRVMSNLMGNEVMRGCSAITRPSIIIADNISPSDAVSLPQHYIRGLATEHGSLTAHVTVLARALGVPAVVGIGESLQAIAVGDEVALDGFRGLLWHKPSEEVKATLLADTKEQRAVQEHRRRLADQLAVTPDGVHVTLLANADHSVGFANIAEHGAEGIGLYRTEYLWIGAGREPTEEEQYQAYTEVLRACNGRPVTLRVLDIGGDKLVGRNTRLHGEANPFLGNRSIRYLLNNKKTFRTQARAMLRAAVTGNCSIMFPMVSTLQELRACNAFFAQCKRELAEEGAPFASNVPTGMMVEVPSAVLMIDALAQETDFFSIGTNDLIQYTFAVDRGNESVAYLYQPLNPVILHMIQLTVKAAKKYNRRVCVCGEMASNPLACMLLIGIGVREVSMSANLIPRVKELICRVSYYDMQRLIDDITRDHCQTEDDVIARAQAIIRKYAPDVLK